jgi:Signal recognition particle 9 kDa protein (SRP9)
MHDLPPPSATLTFKTFETTAGICLKYETTKAAEVGRLMTGLGRIAKGEVIEETSTSIVEPEAKGVKSEDRMNVGVAAQKVEKVSEAAGGGGKAKKKKGKK